LSLEETVVGLLVHLVLALFLFKITYSPFSPYDYFTKKKVNIIENVLGMVGIATLALNTAIKFYNGTIVWMVWVIFIIV
jgi:hypothetical protein